MGGKLQAVICPHLLACTNTYLSKLFPLHHAHRSNSILETGEGKARTKKRLKRERFLPSPCIDSSRANHPLDRSCPTPAFSLLVFWPSLLFALVAVLPHGTIATFLSLRSRTVSSWARCPWTNSTSTGEALAWATPSEPRASAWLPRPPTDCTGRVAVTPWLQPAPMVVSGTLASWSGTTASWDRFADTLERRIFREVGSPSGRQGSHESPGFVCALRCCLA